MLQIAPKDYNIRQERGDVWVKFSNFGKAIKCYTNAMGLTYDKEARKKLTLKIADCNKSEIKLGHVEDLINKANNNDFYDYNIINIETIEGDVLGLLGN